MNLRRPLLGRFGHPVVVVLCGWELVALMPGCPVPTLSELVKRHRVLGVGLLALLVHHWMLEAP